MDAMMNDMMGGGDPFGRSVFFGNPRYPATPQEMLTDASTNHQLRNGHGGRGHHMVQHPMDSMMMNPFGMGGGLFGGFGGLMQHMEHAAHNAMNDPHSTVFTQSTMISFDGEGGQPRVVSNSTRKAGDVKEHRRQVQHGPEIEELTVGHSIGDRSHVIEKKRDKDGHVRKKQRFINLDQEEAEDFNEEFKTRASHNLSSSGQMHASIGGAAPNGSGSSTQQRAIEDGGRRSHATRSGQHRRAADRQHQEGSSGSRGSKPIVTVPDDDEDDDVVMVEERRGHRNGHRSDGPTIREVTDEEADEERSKRRKGGLFGRFG